MRHLLAEIQMENTLCDLAKSSGFRLLHSEGFNNAVTGCSFIKDIRHLGHFVLTGFTELTEFLSEPDRWIEHKRNKHQRHPSQPPIDDENREDEADQNGRLLQKFRQSLRHCSLDPFHIRGNARNQFPRRIEMKKTKGLIQHFFKNIVPQITHDRLAKP